MTCWLSGERSLPSELLVFMTLLFLVNIVFTRTDHSYVVCSILQPHLLDLTNKDFPFIFHYILDLYIHLSNVLTDHFLNSLPEKTTQGIPMKFSQCPFKNIFNRLPLLDCDIYLQIIHVRQKAIFTFNGTCIACVSNITFQIGYFTCQ